MITSSSNHQMKRILQLNKKAKTRYEQRVFVVEGMKMCMEAPKEQVEAMYVSESFLQEESRREAVEGYSYEILSDSLFRAVSDTKTPQGILCLVKMPEYSLEDLCQPASACNAKMPECSLEDLCQPASACNAKMPEQKQKNPHLLILEGIQDPGNLGTMIRAGEGAGATGIIMDKNTVDIFHPKTIRATMGSLYRMPFYIASDLPGTVLSLKERGISIFAAHLESSLAYCQPDYRQPAGFLIGNEGNGLSPKLAGLADVRIRIPMEGQVESLNAAVAAALLMYEAKRQRDEQTD